MIATRTKVFFAVFRHYWLMLDQNIAIGVYLSVLVKILHKMCPAPSLVGLKGLHSPAEACELVIWDFYKSVFVAVWSIVFISSQGVKMTARVFTQLL